MNNDNTLNKDNKNQDEHMTICGHSTELSDEEMINTIVKNNPSVKSISIIGNRIESLDEEKDISSKKQNNKDRRKK